ncbi:helix-turn-helix domain-containing protein [Mesorhizobium sp. BR1-1-7]|uniref:helix-turn-helix domain-containing protein n=1 Tax=Mesorhizobium sp. BR1-1-7 TaxID=2876647 RepID=UPI001CCDCE75|nr:helix-turn-helix transcriptional regulator [Mesorhizobium sp. BR1-1-7]MBZ9922215.1 helix-turn-helix domain-containing protein [Mesorhizobium sp. BR1-1-7]
MTLNEYLSTDAAGKQMTDEVFGKLCGMSQSQISRLRNGKSRPSFEAMEMIRAATGGKVSPNDWFEVAS